MFSYFEAKELNSDNITLLKERLLKDLGEYKNYSGDDLIVVFDGRDDDSLTRNMEREYGISITYSREGKSADTVIEELVNTNANHERIFVVTSDYLQQKVIFKNNVYRKSVREFGAELGRMKRKISEDVRDLDRHARESFYMLEKRIDNQSKDRISIFRKDDKKR